MGQSIDEAHMGRFITSEHYDIFIDLIKKAMIQNNVSEQTEVHQKFLQALMMVKDLVVQQSEQNLSLHQKLAYKGKLDEIMTVFSRRLSSDPTFREYFAQNIMMQQLIHSMVVNFFHVSSTMNEEEI